MLRNNYKSILLGILLLNSLLFAQSNKVFLKKQLNQELKDHKVSFVEKALGGVRDIEYIKNRAKSRNEKLLIMLVEFQEEVEDDPLTTGNGLFLKTVEDEYPIHLGSPPHDQEFYSAHAVAMQQYYRSATWGIFEFDYDIYPAVNGEYYQLPKKMRYYHDTSLPYDEQIARFEQYFVDIFQTVDKDPNVVFGDYDHFMVIHAGSEFQHDTKADTPGDIPSFFIKMGTGKELLVDDGQTEVSYLCNIPEMITQDITHQIQAQETDSIKVYNGVGLINAVMAHEFGHSLGFVDLYNTRTNTPSVGYFDIMDSGGQSLLRYAADSEGYVDTTGTSKEIYGVEGGLPAQPGAWSKVLVWEDELRAKGILKDYSEFDLDKPIEILTNSNMVDTIGAQQAYIVKFPLSEDEYVLIENRQTDPDGDGGSTLQGGLDFRAILYPSYFGDNDAPNHEYDYNLPGWISTDGYAVGGGLLFWKIDNYEIFNQGTSYSDGSWQSNFQNNQVNTNNYRKGVKIIEADGYFDIGNPQSYVWSGSAYDYFYPFKPKLNKYLEFERWYSEADTVDFVNLEGNDLIKERLEKVHTLRLSSSTKPALETYYKDPSGFVFTDFKSEHFENYHNPAKKISFRIKQQSYDRSQVVLESEDSLQIGQIADLNILFPAYNDERLTIFRNDSSFVYEREPDTGDYIFAAPATETNLDYSFKPGIINIGNDENPVYGQVVATKDNVYFSTDLLTYNALDLGGFSDNEKIIKEPLIIVYNDENYVVVQTNIETYIYNIVNTEVTKIGESYKSSAYCEEKSEMILLGEKISIYNFESGESKTYTSDLNYMDNDPIGIYDTSKEELAWFMFDDQYRLVKLFDGEFDIIFTDLDATNAKPTQLAVGYVDETKVPHIIYGRKNRIYAIRADGSLKTGFPKLAEHHNFDPKGYPYILEIDDSFNASITNLMIFPTVGDGYIAYDHFGNYRLDYSYTFPTNNNNYSLYYNDENGIFSFFYVEKSIDVNENSKTKYRAKVAQKAVEKNPIVWSGFRNGASGVFVHNISETENDYIKFNAYTFPHPITSNLGRIRVMGHKEDIDIKIYDIAGNRVFAKKYDYVRGQQDFEIDFSNFASGVYYGVVKSGNATKKIPVAVEK